MKEEEDEGSNEMRSRVSRYIGKSSENASAMTEAGVMAVSCLTHPLSSAVISGVRNMKMPRPR